MVELSSAFELMSFARWIEKIDASGIDQEVIRISITSQIRS